MSAMIPKILAILFGAATLIFLLAILAPKWRKRVVDVVAVGLIALTVYYNTTKRAPSVEPSAFAAAVNLDSIGSIAVQADGRVKSFDSFARRMMRFVSGPHKIGGQAPTFTYLDMMFRPEAYADADVIYVKKKQIRQVIADRLARVSAVETSVLETFQKTGLIAPSLLHHPTVASLLEEM